MTAELIDGKSIAKSLRDEVASDVEELGFQPGLAVILVGEDPASHVYVRNKIKATEEAGMKSIEHKFPANAQAKAIAGLIAQLNLDPDVHGILLQLPLPDHIDADPLIQMIAPHKDVDGLTYTNIGKYLAGDPTGLIPCTPQGSLRLIQSVQHDLSGLDAIVIGRSLLFGKPMGQLLLQSNCTVTMAHSRTKNLAEQCTKADIVVAAVGRTEMVKGDWVKEGAIVIDVGINRQETGKLKGDVDFDAVSQHAKAITPVPGGVGPMTIACLLANTLKATQSN